MDPFSEDHQEERIPSYEESVQHTDMGGSLTNAMDKLQTDQPSLLHQQVSDVRANNIDAMIEVYISPLIRHLGTLGLLKSTFVLVPSDVDSLQRTTPSLTVPSDTIEGFGDAISLDGLETVVGFPSETYVILVRLHGSEFTAVFWRQKVAIKELEDTLKARMSAMGYRVLQTQLTSPQAQGNLAIPGPSRTKTRLSKWRNSGPSQQQPWPNLTIGSSSSWSYQRQETLESGHVRLKVELREVCLRVKTEIGLYETRTGKAVAVNFEVGA